MRNIVKILLCILVFSISEGKAQSLTFNDLKYLLDHDMESADNYVTAKGFRFEEIKKGDNGNCDATHWYLETKNITDYNHNFISKFCFHAKEGFIMYQFEDKSISDKIKSICKSLKFKVITTYISETNNMCSKFENDLYIIEFCSGVTEKFKRNI